MAQQIINIGAVANDGSGTKIRLGGDMINDNFTELYAAEALNTPKVTNATHIGEVTGSGALTITDKAVTLAKMNDVASATVFYRRSAGTGPPEVITLAQLAIDLGIIMGGAQVYSQLFDITAGVITTVVTTVTSKPYSVQFWDSSGNYINAVIDIEEITVGPPGPPLAYAYKVYSVDAMTNVEIRLVY